MGKPQRRKPCNRAQNVTITQVITRSSRAGLVKSFQGPSLSHSYIPLLHGGDSRKHNIHTHSARAGTSKITERQRPTRKCQMINQSLCQTLMASWTARTLGPPRNSLTTRCMGPCPSHMGIPQEGNVTNPQPPNLSPAAVMTAGASTNSAG